MPHDIPITDSGVIASFRAGVAELKLRGIEGPFRIQMDIDTQVALEAQSLYVTKIVKEQNPDSFSLDAHKLQVIRNTLGSWEYEVWAPGFVPANTLRLVPITEMYTKVQLDEIVAAVKKAK